MKILPVGLVFLGVAVGLVSPVSADAQTATLKVYLGNKDRIQQSAEGATCSIVIELRGGPRKILKTEIVTPQETRENLLLNHGGQVITAGDYSVELVLEKPKQDHHHGEPETEHGHGHEEKSAPEQGFPYFQASLPHSASGGKELTFNAVVILKLDGSTFNIRGFEYPFLDFTSVINQMEMVLADVKALIDSDNLARVHAAAEGISHLAESLPSAKDVPTEALAEIESIAQALIDLFREIDEAADAGKEAETIAVYNKYLENIAALKRFVKE